MAYSLMSTGDTAMQHWVGLVLGTICHAEKLIPTWAELHSSGFSVQHLCAFGSADAMAQAAVTLQNVESSDTTVHTLFTDTEPFISLDGSQAVIGSKGAVITTLHKKHHQLHQYGTRSRDNTVSDIFKQLLEDPETECIKLAVAADHYEQITSAAKVLLRYSARSVHTHEFMKSDIAADISH